MGFNGIGPNNVKWWYESYTETLSNIDVLLKYSMMSFE